MQLENPRSCLNLFLFVFVLKQKSFFRAISSSGAT